MAFHNGLFTLQILVDRMAINVSAVNEKVYKAILTINKLLEDYISGVSFYSTMEGFLELLIESTNSQNGFIGKLSGSRRQFVTIVCNQDSAGMGLSLKQLQQSIGELTLDKTVTNYYDCTSQSLRSFISVPIEFEGKLIGYVGLTNKSVQYSANDLEILRFAKNNISSILNHQQNIRVRPVAEHKRAASSSSTSYSASVQ